MGGVDNNRIHTEHTPRVLEQHGHHFSQVLNDLPNGKEVGVEVQSQMTNQ